MGKVFTASAIAVGVLALGLIFMPSGGYLKAASAMFWFGSQNSETINGTNGWDYLIGYGGDDTINGFDGNDYLIAGNGGGYVVLNGGDGNDYLWAGNNGFASLNGNAGNDHLIGGSGTVIMVGGTGADLFECGTGMNYIQDYNPSEGDTVKGSCLFMNPASVPYH